MDKILEYNQFIYNEEEKKRIIEILDNIKHSDDFQKMRREYKGRGSNVGFTKDNTNRFLLTPEGQRLFSGLVPVTLEPEDAFERIFLIADLSNAPKTGDEETDSLNYDLYDSLAELIGFWPIHSPAFDEPGLRKINWITVK